MKDWVRGGRKGRWWHTREGGARQGMRGDRVKYCGLRARDCETCGAVGWAVRRRLMPMAVGGGRGWQAGCADSSPHQVARSPCFESA